MPAVPHLWPIAALPGRIVLGVLVLAGLAACARDSEDALRARLSGWFFLGRTVHFSSRMRCTGAMFHVNTERVRPALAVHDRAGPARAALAAGGVAALRVTGLSPAQLTDALLLSGSGAFGKQALAAGALSGPCFRVPQVSAALYEALNRPGATLVYDAATEGLVVLDPARNRLFYLAGDVW